MRIDELTINLYRLGSLAREGILREGERYIALQESEVPPVQCEMRLGHEGFLRQLHRLRYPEGASKAEVAQALESLGGHAAGLLPEMPEPHGGRPLQIDLVLGAAELWAFPFEACVVGGEPLFAHRDRPIILTRRIREKSLPPSQRSWPVLPRVLFVHAPAARDLAESLIDAHAGALEETLRPWSARGDPRGEGLLRIVCALGTRDLSKAIERGWSDGRPFTHVHLLAHGKGIRDPVTDHLQWGLRLGDEARAATDPRELAEPLAPREGLPAVVTVAACDAANQATPAIPKRSFAQEVHARGVPVVLAPQLPLTQPGSVVMTRAFYDSLLRGDDVRWALHETRARLREAESAGHDWMSLVGYVRLPEGYAEHLLEVGVRLDLERLKAARERLDELDPRKAPKTEATERTFDAIEREVTERIGSLEGRLAAIPSERQALRSECRGVLASAHKRLAELRFWRAWRAAETGEAEAEERYERLSRESLEAALEGYRSAFHADIRNHWLGAQQLALEAALTGALTEPRDWETTRYAAELATARDEGEYWAFGTLAEIWLLEPVRGGGSARLDAAREALESLVERAGRAHDSFAKKSTRDQLGRYVDWWTRSNGFFGGRADLATEAAELIAHMDREERS